MPTFYNVKDPLYNFNFSFDDVFVPIDLFNVGNLFSWGINTDGQLGLNDTSLRNSPIRNYWGFDDWKKVSSGSNFAAGIKSGYLFTWGNGTSGQIGNQSSNSSSIPFWLFTLGAEWADISCGYDHLGAIKSDNTLWMWGNNSNYQIAAPNQTIYNKPTQVGSDLWLKISCGNNFTLAIKKDGRNRLYGWGSNQYGQLGLTANSYSTPSFSSSLYWNQISCGDFHSIGLINDGILLASGRNNNGQLGIGNTTDKNSWTLLSSNLSWKQISCGSEHSAAIKVDGTLWSWGRNDNGQLGLGNASTPVTSPSQVGSDTNWKQISCGKTSTVAVKTDGSLWVWGLNDQNQLGLGDGFSTVITSPQQIGTDYNWRFVSVGDSNFHAIKYQNDYF